jgi:hypothetical protein
MRDLTQVHRSPQKESFDPEVVRQIVASVKVCQVAIAVDGQLFSIPVVCAPYFALAFRFPITSLPGLLGKNEIAK